MATLKLSDLATNGLTLSQSEATLLLPHISKVSQYGYAGQNAIVFDQGILNGDIPKTANKTIK